MRVTNNMLINGLMYNVSKNLEKMSEKQDELATGKRIQRPSDDPVLASKIIKYTTDLAELDQYSKNTSDALSWLETTETAIADIGNVLQRARELTVQAANGTNTVEETQKIKKEMEQLKKVLIANGNFSFAGRNVFSFYHTDMPLLKEDGTFNIDITDYEVNNKPKTKYEIGIGEDLEISTNGLDLFGFIDIPDNLFKNTLNNVTNGDGSEAKKSVMEVNMPLDKDYTAGVFTVDVAGTTFTVDTTGLDFSGTNIADEKIAKANQTKLLSAIQNAVDAAGPPPNALSSVADVYGNTPGNLTIRAKAYGDVVAGAGNDLNVTHTGGAPNVTIVSTTDGQSQQPAVITSPILTPADFANNAFDNKEYVITFNEKTVKIMLDAPIPDEATLQANLQTKIEAAFPAATVGPPAVPGTTVAVTLNGTNQMVISMAKDPAVDDGSKNTITMRPIRAKEPQLIKEFDEMITALGTNDTVAISSFLGKLDVHVNNIVTQRADIGARVNRLELVANRISENNVSFTRLLSDAQDADMAEVIMYLKNAENVYKSSLSAGSRVIQPTLVDFLR